jgi:hypothetical protein
MEKILLLMPCRAILPLKRLGSKYNRPRNDYYKRIETGEALSRPLLFSDGISKRSGEAIHLRLTIGDLRFGIRRI